MSESENGQVACSAGADAERPVWRGDACPTVGDVRQRRQPEGETFLRNVPFPRKPPDLLMAESPRQRAFRVLALTRRPSTRGADGARFRQIRCVRRTTVAQRKIDGSGDLL